MFYLIIHSVRRFYFVLARLLYAFYGYIQVFIKEVHVNFQISTQSLDSKVSI